MCDSTVLPESPKREGPVVKGSITMLIDGEHHDLHMSDMYFHQKRGFLVPGKSGPDGVPVIGVLLASAIRLKRHTTSCRH